MNVLTDHPAIVGIAAYWVFSAIVGGMPPKSATSSQGYNWLHDSLHILAGNLTAAVASKYPTLPTGIAAAEQTTTTTVVSK